jgi:hypothetical protein
MSKVDFFAVQKKRRKHAGFLRPFSAFFLVPANKNWLQNSSYSCHLKALFARLYTALTCFYPKSTKNNLYPSRQQTKVVFPLAYPGGFEPLTFGVGGLQIESSAIPRII